MTFEEKMEKAQKIRAKDKPIPPEILAQIPAVQSEISIPGRDGNPIRVYTLTPNAPLPNPTPLVINFHGGGFLKGRLTRDQRFCRTMAAQTECLFWDVDYSLSPEAPYPAAVNESWDVVSYAFTHGAELGIDTSRIILMGHSSGGNLAATVCLNAAMDGRFKPAGLIMEYSPLDLAADPGSKPVFEGDIPPERAKIYNSFYVAPENARDPFVSPVYAPESLLEAFPETLITTAGKDALCEECERFGNLLVAAGVPVSFRRFRESRHGFTIAFENEWEACHALIREFIRRKIH